MSERDPEAVGKPFIPIESLPTIPLRPIVLDTIRDVRNGFTWPRVDAVMRQPSRLEQCFPKIDEETKKALAQVEKHVSNLLNAGKDFLDQIHAAISAGYPFEDRNAVSFEKRYDEYRTSHSPMKGAGEESFTLDTMENRYIINVDRRIQELSNDDVELGGQISLHCLSPNYNYRSIMIFHTLNATTEPQKPKKTSRECTIYYSNDDSESYFAFHLKEEGMKGTEPTISGALPGSRIGSELPWVPKDAAETLKEVIESLQEATKSFSKL